MKSTLNNDILFVKFLISFVLSPKNNPPNCFLNGKTLRVRIPYYYIKRKTVTNVTVLFGGEQGIRTLETVLAVYTISNRAPSTSSDNSPYQQFNIIYEYLGKIKCFYLNLLIII